MGTAANILIVGGIVNLMYGLLTGLAMAQARAKQPQVSKYLTLTHLGGLMWAPILLSLVLAVQLSDLTAWLETSAAIALVSASGLLDLKDLLNWLQGITDEFRERPLGFYLGGASSVLSILGAAVLLGGAIHAL